MPFSTTSAFKTVVKNYLVPGGGAPSVYDDYINDWIALCEAWFNRELRVRGNEVVATATLDADDADPNRASLPAGLVEIRHVRITSTTPDYTLGSVSPEVMEEMLLNSTEAGRPQYYAVIDGELVVSPATPDQDYTLEMSYWETFTGLSDGAINWVLTNAPDLYLFGTLYQATLQLEGEAQAVSRWDGPRQKALMDLQKAERAAVVTKSTSKLHFSPLPQLYGGSPLYNINTDE